MQAAEFTYILINMCAKSAQTAYLKIANCKRVEFSCWILYASL